ncbi:MAG TPA: methionyl-tRNA formyltransferase [Candidatus Pristimantibacillus sp.]|jgi:methionyl-tRNA formyltransferase|nr:methionyl-tRNA formyltransferase [Candidatus Pristimantibacillus sp.]
MKKTSKPIVFFGSGPVAAASLRLLAQDFTVEAVVTKPRPDHHKGDVPVLAAAEELALPIHTATSRQDLRALFETKPFNSTVGVLIDFGIIVPQEVIDYFPLGIVNSHFSILPEWRGADPITFAILSGQEITGVSLMFLVAAMDEGPLLAYGEQPLEPDTTTPVLTDQLIQLSHALLVHELPQYIEEGTTGGAPQTITGRKISYSRKLTKDDGIIDWNKPAVQLEREIRAFIEWPKSRCTLGGIEVVITKAHVANDSGPAGHTLTINKLPAVYCGQQSLVIDRLKPAGKPEMDGQAFLAGYKQKFLGR